MEKEQNLLKFAIDLARKSGKILKDNLRLDTKITFKEDKTEVTEIDKKINDFVLSSIKKKFPEHDILAEEESSISGKSDYLWACDPIDGTIAFSHGIPTCVFSLALMYKSKPILCAVYDPFMDRMFYAERGKGAYLNGQRIKVSKQNQIERAVLGLAHWKDEPQKLDGVSESLISNGANILNVGSSIYIGILVACGKFDAICFPQKEGYEGAALKILIEEAGGKTSSLYGESQNYDKEIKGMIASNGLIHDSLVRIIKEETT